MRVSDIISYIGKDRQDAERTGVMARTDGNYNSFIINNLIVNIVQNSFNKSFIKMDKEYFEQLKKAKKDNYEKIYGSEEVNEQYETCLKPMFGMLYDKLIEDLKSGDTSKIIFKSHIDYINRRRGYYTAVPYESISTEDDIVTDFIASMTDDYFIDICAHLLPDAPKVKYVGYFD